MNESVEQSPGAFRRHSISLALRATLLTGAILLAAPARDAAAACQDGTTVQAIPASTTGGSLQTIMALSTKPCTLNLAPATYTAPAGTAFIMTDGITLRGAGGAAATFLQAAPAQPVTLFIMPINGSCPSGATVEGLTISGGAWGVLALAGATHPGCPFNQLTDITLRNLVVNTGPGQGHAIYFQSVQRSVVDTCWINSAFANGIYLALGSDHNIVMNNTIAGSFGQHAIAVQSSNDNVIVGNLINVVTSFDGILLNSGVGLGGPGSSRNRIERNTIMGHKVDGIVLTDASGSNYVGLNTAISGSYPPGSSAPLPGTAGTGIWVNNASNANYLYGNDLSGSPENGIDVLASRSTLLVANTVHGNYHGGIWVAYYLAAASPSAPAPQDTVLHGNNIFFNGISRQLFLQSTIDSQAAFNYLSGAQAGVLSSDGTVGIAVQDSASATIFENTVSEVWSRAIVQGVTNTQFFRNRFLKGINTPTFSFPPADVRWDAGSFLGGNHWSEFAAATGNPDLDQPYSAFIGNTGGRPYVDRFPFASDTLQTASIANSIMAVEPVPGSVLAAETRKTIRWVGRGCSFVHLYYGSGTIPPVLIAARYPSTGYYIWNVPSVPFGSDYYVLVQCLDANGVWLGPIDASRNLTIGSNHLVLLNPGRGTRATNAGPLRVAWRASAAVTGVNVYVRSGSGAEIQVASNITGTTFTDIVLPASVSSSSVVTVRIEDSGNRTHQDSVDGYFMVRGPSPSLLTMLASATLQVGSVQLLQWTGPSTGYTVDIDLIGAYATSVVRNLPDYGTFSWFVPDAVSQDARIHATFKDENGHVVGVLDSGTFKVARDPDAPLPPVRNLAAALHDSEGDGKTDPAVFRPSNGTWYLLFSSFGYNAAAPGVVHWGVAGDIPISADFDGDRRTDLTVFRPATGTWYILYSLLAYSGAPGVFHWGLAGDVPIAGDFDGDGRSELTVFRPSTGTWYILYSSLGYNAAVPGIFQWGVTGDVPIAGDFDGDGRTELTVFRPSNGSWYVRYSSLQYSAATPGVVQWGLPGDIPVAGDFDGDGVTELTVFRPSAGAWFIRYSTLGYSLANWDLFQWGVEGDMPIATEFDGDGKADITVYRPSTGHWFIRFSTFGYSSGAPGVLQWGLAGDALIK